MDSVPILRETITPAEAEVWRLTALGDSQKEIADRLNVSIKTVNKHRCALYPKIRARNASDATRLAIIHQVIAVQFGLPPKVCRRWPTPAVVRR